MAKFGEGDKRWIVEDRADGANVHNWHWAEIDCLPWSQKRLRDLLENISILEGEGDLWMQTTTIESVTGEAYVNIRKGKIIPGYEIAIRLSWKGEARDGSTGNPLASVTGSLELPYVADENADEEPELKISVKDVSSPAGQRMREAFLAKGKCIIQTKVSEYVKEIALGGPAKNKFEGKATVKKIVGTGSASVVVEENCSKAPQAKPPAAVKPKVKEGFKTITLSEKFYCRASDLYEILLDENRWKGFTQSAAKISKEVGGSFSFFDGAVTGVNVQLQENKLIMQKWRFTSWVDGHYSNVRSYNNEGFVCIVEKLVFLTLEEPSTGVTVVKLTQTEVPEEDRYGNATVVENTEKGWRDLIFHKIRTGFGFGL